MTRVARNLFIAVVLLQVLVLVAMAAGRETTLRNDARDVTLQTVPVDPRDLLRGDYVVLRYEISTVPSTGLEYARSGYVVYVELVERSRDQWVAGDVDLQPHAGWDRFIQGTVVRFSGDRLEVEYGIEAYFVPEGRGREIERAGDLDVVMALDDEGRAVIRHLIVDGTKWER